MRDYRRTPRAVRAAATPNCLAILGLLAVAAAACNLTDPTGTPQPDGQVPENRACDQSHFDDAFKQLNLTANVNNGCYFSTIYKDGIAGQVNFGAVVRVPRASADPTLQAGPSFDLSIISAYAPYNQVGYASVGNMYYDPNTSDYYRDDVTLATNPGRYHAQAPADTTFLRDSARFTLYGTTQGIVRGYKILIGRLDPRASYIKTPSPAVWPGVTNRFTAVPGYPTVYYTYQWALDGSPVPGAGGPIFDQAFDGQPGDGHTVSVTVFRSDGSSTSATSTVTLQASNPCPDNQVSC